jgi:hypothetical protein
MGDGLTQPVAAAKKIDRRQIVIHGAAVSAAALTLLPKFATAYTDAARSAEPLLIAVPEILPGTPDEGEIARGMTQVVIGDAAKRPFHPHRSCRYRRQNCQR